MSAFSCSPPLCKRAVVPSRSFFHNPGPGVGCPNWPLYTHSIGNAPCNCCPLHKVDEMAVGSTHDGMGLLCGACISGAGLFLSSIPSVRAFQVGSFEFMLAVRRWNGVSPAKTPYTHHCGNCGERRLSDVDVSHLFNCRVWGGHSPPRYNCGCLGTSGVDVRLGVVAAQG
jgi:hypothetical protein